MKALSLWEPWASLMACGAKRNETRSWATNYRGLLAICSSKAQHPFSKELLETIREDVDAYRILNNLRYGFVLCVVRLHGVVPTEVEREVICQQEFAYGNYGPDRFAWQTDRLFKLEPVPVTGRQGLFNLPPDVERQVMEQMKGAAHAI